MYEMEGPGWPSGSDSPVARRISLLATPQRLTGCPANLPAGYPAATHRLPGDSACWLPGKLARYGLHNSEPIPATDPGSPVPASLRIAPEPVSACAVIEFLSPERVALQGVSLKQFKILLPGQGRYQEIAD